MLAFHWYTQHIECSVPKPYLPAKWHRKKGEAWSAKPASRGRGNRAARDGERQTTPGRDTRPSGQAPHAPAHRYGRAPGRPKATPRGYCWRETKAEAALGSSPAAADQGADPKHRAQRNCPLTCPPHSHCHRQHLTSGEQLFFLLLRWLAAQNCVRFWLAFPNVSQELAPLTARALSGGGAERGSRRGGVLWALPRKLGEWRPLAAASGAAGVSAGISAGVVLLWQRWERPAWLL